MHAESLQVVSTTEPDGYEVIYTINSADQKHGVEYSYFPGTKIYSMISHYLHGEPSGPTLYFNRDGSIGHILHITSPLGEKPTLDDIHTYTAVKDI